MLIKLTNKKACHASYLALSMTFSLRRRTLKTYNKTKALTLLKGGSRALRTPQILEDPQQFLQETKKVSMVTWESDFVPCLA